MNSGERPAVAKYVLHYRGERGKLLGTTHDAHVGGHGASQVEGPGQKGAAIVLDKRLVGAHARALAACEDEGRDIRRRANSHAAILHSGLYTLHFAPVKQPLGSPRRRVRGKVSTA